MPSFQRPGLWSKVIINFVCQLNCSVMFYVFWSKMNKHESELAYSMPSFWSISRTTTKSISHPLAKTASKSHTAQILWRAVENKMLQLKNKWFPKFHNRKGMGGESGQDQKNDARPLLRAGEMVTRNTSAEHEEKWKQEYSSKKLFKIYFCVINGVKKIQCSSYSSSSNEEPSKLASMPSASFGEGRS